MKFLSAVVIIFVPVSVYGQTPGSPKERQLATAAMKILDDWHAVEPKAADRHLHLVCWTPSDREFPAEYRARLTRIMKHIQGFYLQEMKRLGLGARTINLKFDDDGLIQIHEVKGLHPAEHYSRQSGSEIRKECLPVLKKAGIDADRETLVLFCNLATWDEANLKFGHKSPYYAGGSYRSGTAWQLDSPELDTRNLGLQKPIIHDREYGRISLGKHNTIFIGGIAHELGHALGLPHCRQRPDETIRGTALMGSGNRTYGDELRGEGRGSFLTLAHGLRLASHPQFSGSIKGFQQEAHAEIDDLSIEAVEKSIQVSGTVSGSPPIYAVVAYFDPEGGGDYDATTACAVPSADGRFSLRCSALPPGKSGELRLFPLHANGSAAGQMSRTRFRYPYKIGKDGTPNLTLIQFKQELGPIVSAINAGQLDEAKKLANKIHSPRAAAIATRLTQPPHRTGAPADFDGDADTVPLTNFAPESAQVGWARPTFDRVPDRTLLIESDEEIFETGIYAHAPAHHRYRVAGKWKTFHGSVGLAAGHEGSVQFEIKGDGRSLWKSQTIKPGNSVTFRISIADVKELELLTDPTDDGPGSDWGMWFDPTLVQ